MPESTPQSLWSATLGSDPPRYGDAVDVHAGFDVAIVGAGYTGLWTALSLIDAQPDLRIVVLERSHVGHGASGRNGGWCSALLPISLTRIASRHGRGPALAWQRAMFDTVNAVGLFAMSVPTTPSRRAARWRRVERVHRRDCSPPSRSTERLACRGARVSGGARRRSRERDGGP